MVVFRWGYTLDCVIPCGWRNAEAHGCLIPVPVEGPDEPDGGLTILVLSLVQVEFQGHEKWFSQMYEIVGVFASVTRAPNLRLFAFLALENYVFCPKNGLFKSRLRINKL